MPLSPYGNIPGRAGMIFYLPSDLYVRTDVVNSSRVRSFQAFTGQQYDVVHDTGNPNTDAAGEFSWLAGGRKGGSVGGYNAITDSKNVIFTGMWNEIMWHGGTPYGNQQFGTEMAYGGGQNWDNVWEANARFHAAVCEAFGFSPADRLKLHQWVYGKWCAAQYLNREMWPQFLAAVIKYTAACKAARSGSGQESPDVEKYAKAQPIVALDDAIKAVATPDRPAETVAPAWVDDPVSGVRFFWVGDRVEATQDVRRSQFAYQTAPDVGGIITKGTAFDVNWLFTAGDGEPWYLTPYNTRVDATKTVRISDSKLSNEEAA